MRQSKPTSTVEEKQSQSDTQYEVEILWSTFSETTSLTIDQIFDICRKHDLWAFQNVQFVDPELIRKGNGMITLTRAFVGG